MTWALCPVQRKVTILLTGDDGSLKNSSQIGSGVDGQVRDILCRIMSVLSPVIIRTKEECLLWPNGARASDPALVHQTHKWSGRLM